MKIIPPPPFQLKLLHPKYWLVWLAFGLLAVIVNFLPYPAIRGLGYRTGSLIMRILKRRRRVAEKNLSLCFPDLPEAQCKALAQRSFQYAGMALMETGMAWFWPKWRVSKHALVFGKQKILDQESNHRGVLVLCSHHLNLEMTARIFSQFAPGYGVYRPHTNPVYEFIQHRGRTRYGHKMIDRQDVKSMLKVLKNGHRLWYLPDHDYGHHNSVFVPFFAVDQAASTAGSSVLIDATRCAVISGVCVVDNGNYMLHIGNDISPKIERRNPTQAATIINQEIETMISRNIPAWMWMHKRFKTRPENHPCLYRNGG
ncbi:LpxL/LpxP family Kdo(2)-lipid IV(A) lauroyl/palmitoleoyl acyltransferase [Vibrio sp.]|uniref:LpxL/LpxP family Kdo(2)-lipid IV(A) lauroyl/palmitoleoyl acyltransferase n=1 Tax=Vibrio sp. TaxID=678 RepID=UPI003D0ED72A